MASGDTLCRFTARSVVPPTSNYATLDRRNNRYVLDFDQSTSESALFEGVMPNQYALGGLDVVLVWSGTGVTSGNVKWTVAFERDDDEGLDTDSDSFASGVSATDASAGTDGELHYTTVSFAAGEIDGLQPGEAFRMKVTRTISGVSGNMAADAELHRLHVVEA
jgi:hypothetical protein